MRTFAIVLAAAVGFACSAQEEPAEQGSATDPAVDTAAVESAIEASDQAWAEAYSAGDAASIAALYASDGVMMPPNGERVEGQASIQEAIATMIASAPGATLELSTTSVDVAAAGDYAYATGTYSMSGTGPDGSAWSDQGKYMQVVENIDGEWKIAADIWNSDMPAPGMEMEEGADHSMEEPAE